MAATDREMKNETPTPTANELAARAEQQPWWQRLLWFAVFWLGGVAVISMVAYALRLVVKSQFPDS